MGDTTLTDTSDAPGADGHLPEIDWRRPASPIEADTLVLEGHRAPKPAIVGFRIARVITRSFEVVGERWVTLALLVFGLGYAPDLLVHLTVHVRYRAGSHDIVAVSEHYVEVIGLMTLAFFVQAAVASAALGAKEKSGPLAAITAVVAALPVLAPVWLAKQYDDVWSFWASWAEPFRRLDAMPLAQLVLTESFAGLAIGIAAVAALAIFTPVALAEHRSLPETLARAWRLMSGSRWKIVGLYGLYLVALFVVSFGTVAVGIASHNGSRGGAFAALGWGVGVVDSALDAFWMVIIASAYLELRRVREGPPEEELAEVFA